MHLGSIYLIVNDFEKSIKFYEKLLQMTVSARNMDRFAQFEFEGHNISIMNGHFDKCNPDKVVHKGEYSEEFDNLAEMALAKNNNKFVFNFWDEDLSAEYERIKNLQISESISKIRYVNAGCPYYFFQFKDPDGNIIEVTGDYANDTYSHGGEF